MKLNKLSIILVTLIASTQVTAAPSNKDDLLVAQKSGSKAMKLQQPDFGMYKLEKGLALVPTSIADPSSVLETKGNSAVVKVSQQNDVVVPGSLVRNIFTGKLAPLSGNITVLLEDNVSAQDVASATGLQLESSFAGTRLAVLSVASDQDVLKASQLLKDSGLVKEAKIEVQDTPYTTR